MVQYFHPIITNQQCLDSRGLFIFTPIFLFSIGGILIKRNKRLFQPLDLFLVLIIIVHLLVISITIKGWGGFTFGPRLTSDMVPYFMYFLIPVVAIFPAIRGMTRIVFLIIFISAICFSFFVHFRGARSIETYKWNALPAKIDNDPSRAWDWSDIQFLRGI